MDLSSLNNVFIVNTVLGKLDLERDLHLIILAYLVYNYFPKEEVKARAIDWWYEKSPRSVKKNMVVFRVGDEKSHRDYGGRPDRYLAVMDKIRGCKSVYQTESILQRRYGNDVNVYEVHQENSFLIVPGKDIYGEMKKEEKSNVKGDHWVETTLEIYSYKTSHDGIVNWIEETTEEWKSQWQGVLRQKTKYVIEITGKKDEGVDWVRYPYKSKATFENTFFPGKETLINELKRFKEGKERYNERGWPWQFGVALTGTRGTGKTRILKCIAHYMERHLFVIKINEYFSVEQLVKVMNGLAGSITLRPDEFIAVFEEIADQTNMIRSRDDEDEEKHESIVKCCGPDGEEVTNMMSANYLLQQRRRFLSEFLPAIDGINERYGGMIIMTTNYVDRLDKALIRPGRIDFHLHMEGGYDRQSTFQVLKNILGDKIEKYSEKNLHSDAVDKYTGAELIQLCRRHENEFHVLEEMFFKNGKSSTWGTFRLAAED